MFKIIPYLYLLIGYYCIYHNYNLDQEYVLILMFMALKVIFHYKKCTISYLECRLRGVKKEQGYIYRFLDGIIELRHSIHFPITLILASYIIYYHFGIKKSGFYFLIKRK
jgi:hypothetical protein